MKKLILVFVVLVSMFSFSQEKYEYVIVPSQFDFQKSQNQFNINLLVKSFFESEGFTVYYDTDELPNELVNNRCKAIYANAIQDSNMFSTKIIVQIKDCQNKILIESFEGTSREKAYEAAYKEAFQFALTSLKGQLNFKNNFEKKEVEEKPVIVEDVVAEVIPATPQKSTNPNQLFALPIENGYKLVDSVPNVIYIIQNSSEGNVFIASKGGIHGVFQKKINGWYFDYYQDGKLISEKVSVKF